ncbi:MAG: hypothetical protein K2M34_03185 [Alphaproteobacteria bacterium]|nr:hypothetical protein [Alphaproteobacteria bacterium]
MDKNIVIDGVRYKLSPADWELQQQILSRAIVVNNDKASPVKSDIKPVATEKVIVISEKLTDIVVNCLVGHINVVYYNCETNVWNTSKYNGYTINGQDTDTKRVKEFKSVMENIPAFNQQYEFAASVTMTIGKAFYPGWAKMISNPQYSQNGEAVVGNIIVKNKATGKYELYCKSWVGVYDFFSPRGAVRSGAFGFADYGARYSVFRAALLAAHTR